MHLQEQPGHWPAFWLYSDCVGKVGDEGRGGTEMDIGALRLELPQNRNCRDTSMVVPPGAGVDLR